MDYKKIIQLGGEAATTEQLRAKVESIIKYWMLLEPMQIKPDILPNEWVKFEQMCDELHLPCFRQEGGHFIIARTYYALSVYLHKAGIDPTAF